MIVGVRVACRTVVAVVALALTGVPLILDACLIACLPAASSSKQAPTSAHACHHDGRGARPSVRDAAKACGHDHDQSGSLLSASATNGTSPRAADAPAALVAIASISPGTRRACGSPPTTSPPASRSFSSRDLPLRV